jgi:phosphoribosylanthranilate isomerase
MTTRAKICGITTRDALNAAIDGGADDIGLVFFAKSPRNLSLNTASALATAARGKVHVVALTVNADDATLADIAAQVHPDYFQFHGDEPPERVAEIKKRHGIPIIKAIPVAAATDAAAARNYRDVADLILFDAKAPAGAPLPGGNGLAFDWRALDGLKDEFDFMLSGGLTPETVVEAIRVTGASAVDVSSGVETAPGVKSPELIRRFLRAVKTAKQT